MTVYVKVPDILYDTCVGCCLSEDDHACLNLRNRVSPDDNKMTVACHRVVWIEDTEAARIAYITLKLEKSNEPSQIHKAE